jgi:GDP-6-deoxy-D-talose 4-dehydrogenase
MMGKRVLITGIQGFTGQHLAAALTAAGHEVHGLTQNITNTQTKGIYKLHQADLANAASLAQALQEVQPQQVVHLAAIAFVGHGDIAAMYSTNLIGTRNLLEGLARTTTPPDAVLLTSSANVYGNSIEGILTEETPAAPANDYAVSKLAMEYMAKLYSERLPIIFSRPFNYTGVGQSESFLLPKIVAHVRRRASMIELGNLNVARDFSDVRTVVQAYVRLLQTPAAVGQTFNMCSGVAYTLNEVLNLVKAISGHDFEVRVNPAFVRANEVKTLVGSRRKLEACIGRLEEIQLTETLRWMLEAPVI